MADGKSVTAGPKENPDLFWGIRGGGGNFGVVTSFEYQLHPVGPEVFGGAVFHPFSEADKLLKFYREWTPTLPDELSTMTGIITAPPEDFVPKELVGTQMIIVGLCYAGSKEDGEKAVKPLRDFNSAPIDLLGPIPYLGLQSMFDMTAPRGIHSYWRTQQLNNLSDETISVIIKEAAKMKSLSPFTALHIHHWEGAVKQTNSDEMAFAHRDSKYVMNIVGNWSAGEDEDKHINWVKEFSQAVQPFATGNLYLNFMTDSGEDRVKAAFGAEKYSRLVQLKNKYDPKNLFRINQNIKPTV